MATGYYLWTIREERLWEDGRDEHIDAIITSLISKTVHGPLWQNTRNGRGDGGQ
ncbi:MAG: hypothetical protein HFG60_09990 [Lachnospiraceae bacterium]|nr:hypothetical protein [Lachnospiraceae bacterium]